MRLRATCFGKESIQNSCKRSLSKTFLNAHLLPGSAAMAPTKKSPSASKIRSSASQPKLQKVKGENFYHNAKTVGRLKMLSGGKAIRDRDGRIIQAAAFQKGEDETKPGRVQPDRRWFGTSPLDVSVHEELRCFDRQYKGDLPDGVGSLPHKPGCETK